MFEPSDKMFLDFLDIHTMHFSTKVLHCQLKSYMVKKQVEPMLYYLKLLLTLCRLHPAFHIVKLTAMPKDLILRRCSKPPRLHCH